VVHELEPKLIIVWNHILSEAYVRIARPPQPQPNYSSNLVPLP